MNWAIAFREKAFEMFTEDPSLMLTLHKDAYELPQ